MKLNLRAGTLLLFFMTLFSCTRKTDTSFITLTNHQGMTASFTTYGARLVSLSVPDKNSTSTNVVWGSDDTAGYHRCKTDPYYGAIIGRYGNRIAGAKFTLDGRNYQLDPNDGVNSLHGGTNGFHTKEWQLSHQADSTVTFRYLSPEGEAGYPGQLVVKVTYTLTSGNALRIAYEATTDQSTVVNLTNHAYWNLNGPGSGDILNHHLLIYADQYLPVDSLLIPLGKPENVSGTPFDFRQETTIGQFIANNNLQLKRDKGYDHNYILNAHEKQRPVAEVTGDLTGIRMQVFTDQPGLQFYSGNFMAGKNRMNGGQRDAYRSGFCLETQHFPNSPNEPGYPSTVLKPGETYRSTTLYRFSLLHSSPSGAR